MLLQIGNNGCVDWIFFLLFFSILSLYNSDPGIGAVTAFALFRNNLRMLV